MRSNNLAPTGGGCVAMGRAHDSRTGLLAIRWWGCRLWRGSSIRRAWWWVVGVRARPGKVHADKVMTGRLTAPICDVVRFGRGSPDVGSSRHCGWSGIAGRSSGRCHGWTAGGGLDAVGPGFWTLVCVRAGGLCGRLLQQTS